MVEETRRPKIILVYGVHLNEKAVTEYLANQLKPLLEQRGFDVEVVEFPAQLTIHKLVEEKSHNGKRLQTEEFDELFYEAYNRWKEYLQKASENTNYIIDLHNSSTFKNITLRRSKFLSGRAAPVTRFLKSDPNNPLTLYYDDKLKFNHFMLEMPAKYKLARYNWYELRHPWHRQSMDYFSVEADLPATIKAGYLSPTVIAKFVHLIDTQVKTRLGIYRAPRSPPFKPKTDKETAMRIEQRKRQLREGMRPR